MKLIQSTITIGLIAMLGTVMYPALVFADRVRVDLPVNTGVLPPDPPSEGGSSGNVVVRAPSTINNVTVTTTGTTATINWSTNDLSLARVSWGTTTEYAMGTIYGEQYNKNHSQLITALQPNTKYYFKLVAVNLGYFEASHMGEFRTLTADAAAGPENVNHFFAKSQNDRIILTWENPSNKNYDEIRIVRSDKFFPLDPLNGTIVYKGTDERFEDTSITPGVIYYYTAFVKDRTGKFSSGALSSAMLLWFSEGDGIDSGLSIVDLQIPFIGTAASVNKFEDLIVSYEDGRIIDSRNLIIPVGENLRLTFPEAKVPEEGAFMTLSIKDSKHLNTDSTFLFNKDTKNKEYTVTTPVFKREQSYDLVVTVFNSSKLIIQKINGSVKIVSASNGEGGDEEINADNISWPAAHPTTAAVVVVGAGATLYLSLRYLRMVRNSNSGPPPKQPPKT